MANGSDGSFVINGADGKPVSIPAKEYYFNTKARCRRMMLNSLSSEARQVYACLELATMGFRQELAVVMDRGQQRPIKSIEIAAQTGLHKQNVSRALTELEEQGLALRSSVDGEVEIYSWSAPSPEKCKLNGSSNRARLPIPSYIPQSWEPLVALAKRWKLQFSIDEVTARDYEAEGAEIARDYENALAITRAFLERVCAQQPPNKEERTERYIERKESSSSEVEPERTTTTNGHPPLEDELAAVLADHGKGTLTPKQFSEVAAIVETLERPEEARQAFLKQHLPERLPRIRHPGALPAIAREFAVLWPSQFTKAKISTKNEFGRCLLCGAGPEFCQCRTG